jgi:hypothetical protein
MLTFLTVAIVSPHNPHFHLFLGEEGISSGKFCHVRLLLILAKGVQGFRPFALFAHVK